MANSLPPDGKDFPLDAPAATQQPAEGKSPLERLASFRFTYLSIFIFLAAYALTMEGLESLLTQHFETAIQAAAEVDPSEGAVIARIQEGIDALLRGSQWIRLGGVRVRAIALGADLQTVLYAGVSPVELPAGSLQVPEATLLPVKIEVYLTIPLSSVAANAIAPVRSSAARAASICNRVSSLAVSAAGPSNRFTSRSDSTCESPATVVLSNLDGIGVSRP